MCLPIPCSRCVCVQLTAQINFFIFQQNPDFVCRYVQFYNFVSTFKPFAVFLCTNYRQKANQFGPSAQFHIDRRREIKIKCNRDAAREYVSNTMISIESTTNNNSTRNACQSSQEKENTRKQIKNANKFVNEKSKLMVSCYQKHNKSKASSVCVGFREIHATHWINMSVNKTDVFFQRPL